MQDRCGTVGDSRIAVDEHMDVILILGGLGAVDDLGEKIRRGQGAHPPHDTDGLCHNAMLLLIFYMELARGASPSCR